jgi:hypothetical protein
MSKTTRLIVLALVASLGCTSEGKKDDRQKWEVNAGKRTPTREARSRAAFKAAFPVFMHPRCLNCHPAGDRPLAGEDSHLHAQNVQRGADGRGKLALRCMACHQDANLPGENMPPGYPDWRLPAAAMPMVFQGHTPATLAKQLKDPAKNGGKSLEQLLDHVSKDGLVLRCWEPGDGRSVPPLSQAEFAARMKEWVETGAAIPD